MTWTYTGDPAQRSIDAVRFLAGLTSTGDAVTASDEEIEWAYAQEGNAYGAAASVCETVGVRYASKATSRRVGELAITVGDRSVEFRDRASTLRARSALDTTVPFAGGISAADKLTRQGDGDRELPFFAKGDGDRTDVPERANENVWTVGPRSTGAL